jgi:hypothetical protein
MNQTLNIFFSYLFFIILLSQSYNPGHKFYMLTKAGLNKLNMLPFKYF